MGMHSRQTTRRAEALLSLLIFRSAISVGAQSLPGSVDPSFSVNPANEQRVIGNAGPTQHDGRQPFAASLRRTLFPTIQQIPSVDVHLSVYIRSTFDHGSITVRSRSNADRMVIETSSKPDRMVNVTGQAENASLTPTRLAGGGPGVAWASIRH
jgi:hypothetical protein